MHLSKSRYKRGLHCNKQLWLSTHKYGLGNYDKNFSIVEKYLKPFYKDFKLPDAGFFLWLKVRDDQQAAKILWNKFSLRVMPGSFMGKDINGINPGNGFLRISLVDNKDVIEETMKRIQLFLQSEIS